MSFFVTGGTLQSDAPSYVEREADRQLYEGLLQGDFCYVLTARQMGKSSLMVRTANRLRMAGVHVAVLDLTALGGQNITPQQWYFGLLDTLGQEMGLCNELEAFWQENEHLGPLHRFIKSLRHIVLPRLELTADSISPQPGVDETTPVVPQALPVTRIDDETPRSISTKVRLVIFVDEIDFVRSFPFSTDEFFAAIRECYNHRTRDSTYEQVTFCLLGVASPSDLVRDTRTTPFNIGRRIELNDFTPLEATALAQGLEVANPEYRRSKAVLDRILYWTEGHPYLTQRLCRAAAEALGATDFRAGPMSESPSQSVDGLCAGLFFSARARERDDNLIFVRERLLRNDADLASLLDLYLKIWQGKRVMDDEFDPLINLLRLSGVAHVSQGRLHIRSRIYAHVFDDEWVRSNMPEAELRRQREAYRRGVIWAASRSTVIIIALGLLIVVAVNKTSEAYLNQAKAWRSSGQMGQRINALDAIKKATAWGILYPDLSKLRNEAIAALNLVDLEKRPAVVGSEHDVTGPELNATFSSYAVADRAGGIRIMDIERRTVELALAPVGPPVRWLRFSSADEYLAVQYGSDAGGEQCFVLWRLMDKSRIFELGEDIIRDAWDISPNGSRLAIGLSQQDIRIYSLPGGELLPEKVPALAQREEERRTSCLRFDPSGMRLASCSKANLDVQVWSMADSKVDTIPHRDGVVDLDWHPDGHQLVTACQNGDIYLIDLESKIKDRLFGTSSPLRQPEVCFNHLGTVLAAICRDSSLRLWRPENRRPILASFDVEDVLEVREGVGLRFSADDRRLNLNAEKRRVRLLQVEGGRELVTLHGELGATDAFHSIAFDPHGRVVMAAGARGAIRLWDIRDPHLLGLVNLGGLVSTVKIDRDGTTLLGSTTGGFFQLPLRYDRQTSDEELRIGPAKCLALRAGLGRFALTTNGTVALVHVGKKADQIQVFPLRDPERDSWWTADTKLDEIAIAPDGRWLFGCASEGRKRILAWDLFGEKRNEPCKSFPGSRHFALSPSGRWLVTPWAGQFRFWRVGKTWRESALHIPQTHPVEQFSPVAFASLAEPDECLLAVATTPTTIELFRFFDRAALRLEKLFELESPDRLPVVSLAIDGTFGRLAAGSDGQIVQIWDLAEIREKLHQRGIASGLPKFAPVSSNRLRFIVEPSTQSEEAKAALQAQEVWLITVEELTEKIKRAERNGGSGLSSNLVERAQKYRVLNRPELALDDFERALKLRPDDELTRRRKAALEQEIMSKRR